MDSEQTVAIRRMACEAKRVAANGNLEPAVKEQLTPGPWFDMGDSSDEASDIIRIKTTNGWVDATKVDFAAMLAAPDLLVALKKCLLVLSGEEMTKSSLLAALEGGLLAIKKVSGSAE